MTKMIGCIVLAEVVYLKHILIVSVKISEGLGILFWHELLMSKFDGFKYFETWITNFQRRQRII